VHDIEFEMKSITVRSGKGDKDRITTFPASVIPMLKTHLAKIRILHAQDISQGNGSVYLPHTLERKYKNAAKEWQWQYVFPPGNMSTDPRIGITRHHHVDPSMVNKAIKTAVRKAGLHKHITAHTYYHPYDSARPRGCESVG